MYTCAINLISSYRVAAIQIIRNGIVKAPRIVSKNTRDGCGLTHSGDRVTGLDRHSLL